MTAMHNDPTIGTIADVVKDQPSTNGSHATAVGTKSNPRENTPVAKATPPQGPATSAKPQQSAAGEQSKQPLPTITRVAVGMIIAYYLCCFGFLFWLFLDVDLGNFTVVNWLLGKGPDELLKNLDPRFGYVMIGGAVGSILYSIRVLHKNFIDGTWDNRWLGKYITAPVEGAVLAVVVFVLLQGGAALVGISGAYSSDTVNPMAILGISLLVGFSTTDVVKWLEARAKELFKVESTTPAADEADLEKKAPSPQGQLAPQNP